MGWDTNLWEQRSCSRQARLEEAHGYRPFHRVMLRQSSGEGSQRVEAFHPQASSRSHRRSRFPDGASARAANALAGGGLHAASLPWSNQLDPRNTSTADLPRCYPSRYKCATAAPKSRAPIATPPWRSNETCYRKWLDGNRGAYVSGQSSSPIPAAEN